MTGEEVAYTMTSSLNPDAPAFTQHDSQSTAVSSSVPMPPPATMTSVTNVFEHALVDLAKIRKLRQEIIKGVNPIYTVPPGAEVATYEWDHAAADASNIDVVMAESAQDQVAQVPLSSVPAVAVQPDLAQQSTKLGSVVTAKTEELPPKTQAQSTRFPFSKGDQGLHSLPARPVQVKEEPLVLPPPANLPSKPKTEADYNWAEAAAKRQRPNSPDPQRRERRLSDQSSTSRPGLARRRSPSPPSRLRNRPESPPGRRRSRSPPHRRPSSPISGRPRQRSRSFSPMRRPLDQRVSPPPPSLRSRLRDSPEDTRDRGRRSEDDNYRLDGRALARRRSPGGSPDSYIPDYARRRSLSPRSARDDRRPNGAPYNQNQRMGDAPPLRLQDRLDTPAKPLASRIGPGIDQGPLPQHTKSLSERLGSISGSNSAIQDQGNGGSLLDRVGLANPRPPVSSVPLAGRLGLAADSPKTAVAKAAVINHSRTPSIAKSSDVSALDGVPLIVASPVGRSEPPNRFPIVKIEAQPSGVDDSLDGKPLQDNNVTDRDTVSRQQGPNDTGRPRLPLTKPDVSALDGVPLQAPPPDIDGAPLVSADHTIRSKPQPAARPTRQPSPIDRRPPPPASRSPPKADQRRPRSPVRDALLPPGRSSLSRSSGPDNRSARERSEAPVERQLSRSIGSSASGRAPVGGRGDRQEPPRPPESAVRRPLASSQPARSEALRSDRPNFANGPSAGYDRPQLRPDDR